MASSVQLGVMTQSEEWASQQAYLCMSTQLLFPGLADPFRPFQKEVPRLVKSSM
jgi:hypothetical protein